MARVKNRWIVVKIEVNDKSSQQTNVIDRILKPLVIKGEVDKTAELLFGLLKGNFVSNSISVQFTNASESVALLQCRRSFLEETIVILEFINKIQNIHLKLVPVRVCGTLHQARKYILANILDSLSQIALLELAGHRIPEKSKLISGISRISLVSNSSLQT